jgi:ribosomal protein S18 acetylase RimI-like enzyme
MITIRPYTPIRVDELNLLTGPITCHDTYRVSYHDSPARCGFELELIPLPSPHIHQYTHIDEEWLRQYLALADLSLGAYDGEQLVGVLIAETRRWNDSLWVWEFHVAAARRGQGIGRLLMETAAQTAIQTGLRVIVCETQNTNSSAIKAYRGLGFRPEGLDISYYTNQDFPGGDIAVFMKRRLSA